MLIPDNVCPIYVLQYGLFLWLCEDMVPTAKLIWRNTWTAGRLWPMNSPGSGRRRRKFYFNIMRDSEPGIEPAVFNILSTNHIHNILVLLLKKCWNLDRVWSRPIVWFAEKETFLIKWSQILLYILGWLLDRGLDWMIEFINLIHSTHNYK
jgi:hypothetical protein